MKYLTVEFAGLSALVVNHGETPTAAEAWLVKADRHCQTMTTVCVRHNRPDGQTPHTIVAIPGHAIEYAVWSLAGCGVSFKSDVDTPLRVERLGEYANLSSAVQATGMAQEPPVATRVGLVGTVTPVAMPPSYAREYHFVDHLNAPLTRSAPVAWRFKCEIPFERELTMKWEGRGVGGTLGFTESEHIAIGNVCEYPAIAGGAETDHFEHFKTLVVPGRDAYFRSIDPDRPGSGVFIWDPEHCIVALIIAGGAWACGIPLPVL